MSRRLLILSAIAFCIPGVALACSCMPQRVEERTEGSQAVFLGEAVSTSASERGSSWMIVRFSVREAWKGARGVSEDVNVPSSISSCSMEIVIGRRYVVFARAAENGELSTGLCDGTREEAGAEDDLAYLRSLPAVKPGNRFPDVPTDHPYDAAIAAFKKKGLISGYPDGSFRAERPISRAEVVQILAEHVLPQDVIWREQSQYAFTSAGLPFSDLPEREWYNLAIRRAYRAGLIEGYRDGTFRPSRSVSVAEATKLVVQSLALEQPALGAVWYERYLRAAEARNAIPPTVTSPNASMTRGEFVELLWRLSEHVENRDSISVDRLMHR